MSVPDRAFAESESQLVPINGLDYHLACWGSDDAPLVLFLHGWGDNGCTFQFLAESLVDHWRIVAPDWRGFGRTRSDGQAFYFPNYLADLDCLLDALSPDQPATIVGHSMGGNVVGLYAGVRPNRVARVVNLEGLGLPPSDPDDAPDKYSDWLDALHKPRPFRQFDDFASLEHYLKARFPRLTDDRAAIVARCWGEARDGRVRLLVDPKHRLPNPVLYRRAEAEACWRRITADYLFIAGADSEWANANTIDAVVRHIPQAKSCVIPDAGHMLHFDAPERVAREIDRFLRL